MRPARTIVAWAIAAAGCSTTVVPVEPASVRALALCTGLEHVCARTEDGRVFCWGNNSHGQLGSDSEGTAPRWVTGLEGVTRISCGSEHTCAVAGGLVYCWGYNHVGQLGRDDLRDATTPTLVAGLAEVDVIAAGGRNTCALIEGRAHCWGDNTIGVLGTGAVEGEMRAEPVLIDGVDGVDELAVGSFHACARSGSSIACWGNNFHGQLGDGTRDNSAAPVAVLSMTDAVELTGGNLHACARRRDDTVWCWGINELLQVGASVGTVSPTPVQPYAVPPSGWVQSAVAGHTCAGPALFCWGFENRHGELGDGRGRFVTRPIAAEVAPATTARLYPGAGFTCALLEDGDVACWGRGEAGQLGDGALEDRLTPVTVAAPEAMGSSARF